MVVIEADEVSKWYGDVIAVNDVSVEVEPGVTGLLGPNGAGKSTLLRMVMGLVHPSAGSLRVLDEDPWDNAELRKRVGYVPDGDAPWRHKTGRHVLEFGARLGGMDDAEAQDAATRTLERVGLTHAADRQVEGYSRGMRQKIKFGLALLHDPDLLILDEPLLGTDPLSRRDLIQLIKDFRKEGKSVLVSTHVLPDVQAMTERIMLVNKGRLLAHGTVAEVRDLLERYPRTVRVATPTPRDLAALVITWPTVLSATVEEGGILVETTQPQPFFETLQTALVDKDLPFTGVASTDDTVEAVFEYLVG